MNSKERVRTALSRKTPDRVPIFASYVPEVTSALKKRLKFEDEIDMQVELGNDMLMSGTGISESFYGEGDEYICPWGCKWKYFKNNAGSYTTIIEHPLEKDIDGSLLAAYETPDPNDDLQYEPIRKILGKYGRTHWICGTVTCSIFEAAWYLRGLDNFIIDMATDEDYANALLDKTMEFALKAGQRFIDEGVDMVWLGDDVGMQSTMFISPEMWRRFLKPRMQKIIASYKQRNPEIKVAYHSCGYIVPIIDDLIEIGVDVLNPIQPMAMDPAQLKTKFGDRMSFWGSICIQQTLPKGTREDIFNEVRLRMETIGKGGGLIIGPAHNIQADTSVDNILAFYEAAKQDVRY